MVKVILCIQFGLFRELPAGVPGAFRLMANLIGGFTGLGRKTKIMSGINEVVQ